MGNFQRESDYINQSIAEKWAIDYLMGFAWTIAIIFIILWAYKIALWSLNNDKSKWKEMVVLAISWLILASLAWVILKIIIDNFS